MTDSAKLPFEGGCTCRVVRYRMTDTPLFVHCCHCHWCQRETGVAAVPEYYDRNKYWPQTSLERRQRLFGS